MRTRRSLVLAVAAVAVITLSGCSAIGGLLGGGDAQRDEKGNVVEDANIDIFSLQVGDCMPATDSSGEVQHIDVVPCGEPHAQEVYHEFSLPDGDFPDDDALNAAAADECVPAFEEFVGIAFEASVLDAYPITPTAETWEQADDRVVQCVIFDPADDQLEGSLAGAQR